jgi:Spy/CpxP family protein refolding chaperone
MNGIVRSIFGVAAGALVFIGTGAGTTWAQPQTPPGAPMGRGIEAMASYDYDALPFLLRAVSLTSDQETKVGGILSSHQTSTISMIEQLQQAEDEFAAKLFAAGQVQRSDLDAQLRRINQLHEQLSQDAVQTALEIRTVLTPDQIRKAGQVRDRLKQLHEEMQRLLAPGSKP